MWIKYLLFIFAFFGFGLLSSGGVFTVFVTVGLVPRFAGKTHTAKKVFLYEEMVIFGTLIGGFASVFSEYSQIAAMLQTYFPKQIMLWNGLGIVIQIIFGLFSGMFIGCLALAIAEMLDSIPIFARRISFRHGIGLVILGVAIGKLCGSVLYFVKELHRVMN